MSAVAMILAGILSVLGSAFAAVAALGILRLPDLYTRMHAASKAGSVGSGMSLAALALASDNSGEVLRALLAIAFFLLTAPISAHLLAKAAYAVGYRLWPGSVLDEMPRIEPSIDGCNTPPLAPGRAEPELRTPSRPNPRDA